MLARYGIVPRAEIVREVILSGTPSHVVNLAAFIRWLVAAAVIVVGYVFALNRWPVSVIALLLVGASALLVRMAMKVKSRHCHSPINFIVSS